MSDTKLENLTAASTIAGSELVYIVQGGNSRKATVLELIKILLPTRDETGPSDDVDKVLAIALDGTLVWKINTSFMTGAQIITALDDELGYDSWFLPDFTAPGDNGKYLTITSGALTWAIPPTGLLDAASDGKLYGRKDGAWTEVTIPLVSIVTDTANRTAVIGDASKYVRMNLATANTYTIPPNSSVAFPVGSLITVRQAGAGQTTLVAGSGVTLNTAETLKLRKQGSTVSLIKIDTNIWDVTGDLELL